MNRVAVLVALLGLLALLTPCCTDGAPERVLVVEAHAAPTQLPFSGGTVRITATLDLTLDEVVTVTASVVFPDGDTESVGLHPATENQAALQAVFDIPANGDGAGEAAPDRIELKAETESGLRQEIDVGIVKFAGAMDPPSPPQD